MDFFLKYKIIILRTLGILMLVVSLAVYFWSTPKEGLSANDRAAANVARMEAKAAGKSSVGSSAKKDDSKFLEDLKNKQTQQAQYLVIIIMLFGIGFLGYSFVPKKED